MRSFKRDVMSPESVIMCPKSLNPDTLLSLSLCMCGQEGPCKARALPHRPQTSCSLPPPSWTHGRGAACLSTWFFRSPASKARKELVYHVTMLTGSSVMYTGLALWMREVYQKGSWWQDGELKAAEDPIGWRKKK